MIGLFIVVDMFFSRMSCLYISDINPLLVTSFADTFSQSIGCLFILFMVSSAVQKLISDPVPFVYFYFYLGHAGRLT